MAFKKKTATDGFCSNVTINRLANEAAEATTIAKFYEEKYKALKGDLDTYLRYDENAPEVVIGSDGTIRVQDVGTITFTSPRRLQQDAAKSLLLARVKAGTLTVDDLVACVSTFSVSETEKVLSSEELESVKKPDETEDGQPIVTITLRPGSDFKADALARHNVLDKIAKSDPEAPVVAEREKKVA